MSFDTGFSPKPLGTIFRRRRPRRRIVRAGSSFASRAEGNGQTEVGDTRLEIVVKAGERARRDYGVVGADAAYQIARDR